MSIDNVEEKLPYNQDKGLKNFSGVLKPALEEFSKETPLRFALLAAFQEAFKLKVGVMPEFETTDTVLDVEGNEVSPEIVTEVIFAGKRLGEAALKTVTEINDLNIEFTAFTDLVMANYHSLKKSPVINRTVTPEYQAMQDKLYQEIHSNSAEVIVGGDDTVFEMVDLLSEAPSEELNTEGLRSLGYIPRDFNTLIDNASKFLGDNPDYGMVDKSKPEGIIKHENNTEEWQILCPKCFSTIHVTTSFNEFMCLDCDTEFTCKLGLGDLYSTEEDAEGMLNKFFSETEG